jgi:hypothetical protein
LWDKVASRQLRWQAKDIAQRVSLLMTASSFARSALIDDGAPMISVAKMWYV